MVIGQSRYTPITPTAPRERVGGQAGGCLTLPNPWAPAAPASPLGWLTLSPMVFGSRGLRLFPGPTECRSPWGSSPSLRIPRMQVGHCCPQLGAWISALGFSNQNSPKSLK